MYTLLALSTFKKYVGEGGHLLLPLSAEGEKIVVKTTRKTRLCDSDGFDGSAYLQSHLKALPSQGRS